MTPAQQSRPDATSGGDWLAEQMLDFCIELHGRQTDIVDADSEVSTINGLRCSRAKRLCK